MRPTRARKHCAASSPEDQARITQVAGTGDPDGFAGAWLRAQDLSWAAGLLPAWPGAAAAGPREHLMETMDEAP